MFEWQLREWRHQRKGTVASIEEHVSHVAGIARQTQAVARSLAEQADALVNAGQDSITALEEELKAVRAERVKVLLDAARTTKLWDRKKEQIDAEYGKAQNDVSDQIAVVQSERRTRYQTTLSCYDAIKQTIIDTEKEQDTCAFKLTKYASERDGTSVSPSVPPSLLCVHSIVWSVR